MNSYAFGPSARSDLPRIGIIGAGVGGLALALGLKRAGLRTTVYEQAESFERIGSGINISPNATAALRGLGVVPVLEPYVSLPDSWRNYDATTAALIHDFPLGHQAIANYGEPFIQMHRGDLHTVLTEAVPAESVHMGRRLAGLEERNSCVRMHFADGSSAEADLVVGADGIRSRVRAEVFGDDNPRYTGRVAYRDVITTVGLDTAGIDDFAKWWGTDRHIVCYFINAGREIYYVTSVPEKDWTRESWSTRGNVAELRAAFTEFPEPVQRVLRHGARNRDWTYKWALCDRDPMDRWGRGRVVLLGDSCHPMTPYMAQGAAMALEDAVILCRCLTRSPVDLGRAMADYVATRLARASWMQTESHKNTFMGDQTSTNSIYGYNPWTAELTTTAAA